MVTIRDFVADAAFLLGDGTLRARKPWSPASEAVVADDDETSDGFDYLLEAEVVREVVAVWSN